jgi:hypothetical protein
MEVGRFGRLVKQMDAARRFAGNIFWNLELGPASRGSGSAACEKRAGGICICTDANVAQDSMRTFARWGAYLDADIMELL